MKRVGRPRAETRQSSKSTNANSVDEIPPRSRALTPPSKSPSRRRASPATPKSTTRRSPSRKSPSRKSPARKSPSRKSPSRAVKEETKSPQSRPSIRLATASIKDNAYVPLIRNMDMDIKNEEIFISSVRKSSDKNGIESSSSAKSIVKDRRPKLAETITVTRRSSRWKEIENFENMLHLAQNTALPKTENSFDGLENEQFSEDDSPPVLIAPRQLITPLIKETSKPHNYEFGGPIGVVFTMIFSFLVHAANISCSNQPCSFTTLPDFSRYALLKSWFTTRAFLVVLAYVLLQVLLSLIPFFGKTTTLPDGKKTFVANSIFSLIITMAVGFAVEKTYYPISKIIYDDYIQLLMISTVFGLLLAITLFVKGGKLPKEERNPSGNTESAIYNFFSGREINPTLFKLIHVKVVLYRIAAIGVIFVNLVWMYRNTTIKNLPSLTNGSLYEMNTYHQMAQAISISPTLLLFCGMQIIYLLDSLYYESYQVSTFEFMHEGCGFMPCVGCFIYPYMLTLITKRILDQKIVLPNYILIGTFVLFLIGWYIYRASNSQKAIFRMNHLDPRVAHLETLPTMQGKRLIISGWWGFVRHPNYLGDLIMHTAWGVGCYNAIPIYLILFTFPLLIDRVKRDGDRCSQRYGVAWKRYCQRVPYGILPRVY